MAGLTLTQREQARLHTLNWVLEHQMGVQEAACVLGLSERHVWRILAAYRKEGAAALAHGNRGRRSANITPEEIRDRVITLAGRRYAGFNHTHLTELLAEREGVTLARSTVRSILHGKQTNHASTPVGPAICLVDNTSAEPYAGNSMVTVLPAPG